MTDRLDELKGLSGGGAIAINLEPNNEELPPFNPQDDGFISEFNKKVEQINSTLHDVKNSNERIKQINREYERATLSSKEQEVSMQMNQVINQNGQYNEKLKVLLNELNDEVIKCQKDAPDEPETRMKCNLQQAIINKTKEVLKESQELQIKFQTNLKDKVSRQARYVDPSISDDQIKEICNNPEKGGQLLQEKMFGTASIQLQNAVSDIQDKFRDIKKLEESVTAVYQMFVDMALLVHQQGEMLDNIELNVNDAKNYVEKGEKQLQKAKKSHQAARKKMCCIIIIALVVLAVILGPSLGTKLA